MEYILFKDTFKNLEQIASKVDTICVSFSGGKDSWVCMDLCCKTFKKVFGFHMYFIPGLEVVEDQLALAEKKYGVTILQYPHWVLARNIKNSIYCDTHWKTADAIWEYNLNDLYKALVWETKAKLIAHGGKDSDSFWRRMTIKTISADFVIYPIKKWKKFDVENYLKINGIALPDSSGKNATGVDLSTPSLLWLHDSHPKDFQKLLKFFPYAEAVIKRRDLYGVC